MIRLHPIIKNVFFPVGLLYLLLGLFLVKIIDVEMLRLKLLDETKLPLDYLILLPDGKVPFKEGVLRMQLKYYERLHSFIPENAEVNGILGFCYYYLGDVPRAVSSFQKAIKDKPYLFWNYYDLGMIYFQNKNYSDAIDYLALGLNQPPKLLPEIVTVSHFYHNFDDPVKNIDGLPDLLRWDLNDVIMEHLAQGRENTYKILMLCYEETKNYPAIIRLSMVALAEDVSDKSFFQYYLGLGTFQLKKYDQAIPMLTQCLSGNPRNFEAVRLLAMCYESLGDAAQAQFYLQKFKGMNSSASSLKDILNVSVQLRIF